MQRGAGIGSVLSRVFRAIIPIFSKPAVKTTLKSLGSAALDAGIQAVSKKFENPSISLKSAFQEGAKKFKQDAKDELKKAFESELSSRKRPLSTEEDTVGSGMARKKRRQSSVRRRSVGIGTGKKAIRKRTHRSRPLDIFDFIRGKRITTKRRSKQSA
jgi:hypothetical protein